MSHITFKLWLENCKLNFKFTYMNLLRYMQKTTVRHFNYSATDLAFHRTQRHFYT